MSGGEPSPTWTSTQPGTHNAPGRSTSCFPGTTLTLRKAGNTWKRNNGAAWCSSKSWPMRLSEDLSLVLLLNPLPRLTHNRHDRHTRLPSEKIQSLRPRATPLPGHADLPDPSSRLLLCPVSPAPG